MTLLHRMHIKQLNWIAMLAIALVLNQTKRKHLTHQVIIYSNIYIPFFNYVFAAGPCAYNPDTVDTSVAYSFGVKLKEDKIIDTPGMLKSISYYLLFSLKMYSEPESRLA